MAAATPEAVESRIVEALASFGPDVEQVTRTATLRGAGHRLARPRRAGPDRRGRVGRRAEGRRHEVAEDGRRRDRPRGGAGSLMKRRVVITGVGAVTPLGVGAEPLLRRWAAGEVGISGRGRRLPRLRRQGAPVRQGGPPQRPLRPAGDGRQRRGARAGRLERREAVRRRADRLHPSPPASAASSRSRASTTTCATRATRPSRRCRSRCSWSTPEPRRCRCATACAGRASRSARRARRAATRSAPRCG